jgi:hypothetical protein
MEVVDSENESRRTHRLFESDWESTEMESANSGLPKVHSNQGARGRHSLPQTHVQERIFLHSTSFSFARSVFHFFATNKRRKTCHPPPFPHVGDDCPTGVCVSIANEKRGVHKEPGEYSLCRRKRSVDARNPQCCSHKASCTSISHSPTTACYREALPFSATHAKQASEDSEEETQRRKSCSRTTLGSPRITRDTCKIGGRGRDVDEVLGAQKEGNTDALFAMGNGSRPQPHVESGESACLEVRHAKQDTLRRFAKCYGLPFVSGLLNSVFGSGKVWEKYIPQHVKQNAPLHLPQVTPLRLRKLVLEMKRRNWSTAPFEFLWDKGRYPPAPPERKAFPQSSITPSQIEQGRSSAIFEVADEDGGYVSYLFLVFEEGKVRWRVVHDCISANVLCPSPPAVEFDSLSHVRRFVLKFRYALEFDFKAFFYQFPLSKDVRKFFTFRVGETMWQPCRLPMGFTHAVSIANVTSRFLSHNLHPEVVSLVYVDNIVLLGDRYVSVLDAAQSFVSRCAEFGVTIGSQTAVSSDVIFRGISFHLSSQQLQIKQEFKEKFRKRLEWGRIEGNTWGETRSLLSMAIYGLSVLGIPLSHAFYLLQFLIKNIDSRPKKRVEMWQVVKMQWRELVEVILQNKRVTPVMSTTMKGVLVTDARGDGTIAAIYSRNGLLRADWKRVKESHIADLEARAVTFALERWNFASGVYALFCDNLVVLYSLKKGWSKRFAVNVEIRKIFNLLREKKMELELFYVPSEKNCADPLTRFSVMSAAQFSFFSFVGNASALGWAEVARDRLGFTTCQ